MEEEGKRKFLREARTMAKMIKQPEIVNVREFFEANNTAYIIMEFINGITYKELEQQQKGRLTTEDILKSFDPLFAALTNLHAAGLIHRDISPDNLMPENGKIRLLDFGCTRDTASSDATRTIMTKHGYASLEQYGNGSQEAFCQVLFLVIDAFLLPFTAE